MKILGLFVISFLFVNLSYANELDRFMFDLCSGGEVRSQESTLSCTVSKKVSDINEEGFYSRQFCHHTYNRDSQEVASDCDNHRISNRQSRCCQMLWDCCEQ